MNKTCNECNFFKRGKWIKELGGGNRLGGTCKTLLKVLSIENSVMIYMETISVQDTFGCLLWKKKGNKQ